VLAKKAGALLTFAALDAGSATAPGQPTVEQLKTLYRWDALTAATRVYGVIGYPVGHSMSPAIHNAGFDAIGYDGVYLPLPIPPEYEHLKATLIQWLDSEAMSFRGASVTLPHKEHLVRFVREQGGQVDALAARIGAANTLLVEPGGALRCTNTDAPAAVDALRRDALLGQQVPAAPGVVPLGRPTRQRLLVGGLGLVAEVRGRGGVEVGQVAAGQLGLQRRVQVNLRLLHRYQLIARRVCHHENREYLRDADADIAVSHVRFGTLVDQYQFVQISSAPELNHLF
jgi:3-dehydroquinate dehydratase/shikimate dehydrogenase